MYIPEPSPSQQPIPKRRSDHFVEGLMKSRHVGTTNVDDNDGRMYSRGYNDEQLFQTAAWGREYGTGRRGVSVFKLNSIDTPGTRRQVVIDTDSRTIITALPREEIPAETKPRTSRAPKSNSKSRKREQKARKHLRNPPKDK